ncbi:MAG: Ig-like domain repeat protein [Bryobacteraceae bacterium]
MSAPLLALICAGLAAAQTGLIQTYAGNGSQGYSGDGGAATSASMSNPLGLVLDANGDLFIAVPGNERVRMVSQSSGIITTVAGGGTGGAGGLATAAQLLGPCDVKLDSTGNIFLSDTCMEASGGGGGTGGGVSGRIWRVDAVSGIITSIAGGGNSGSIGDGGPATSASLNTPVGIAIDASGNIFIADSGNNRIRRVDATTGIITTVAGNGTAAFAGDGGLATAASLNSPDGVAVDTAGNLYVADSQNNRIRMIAAATGIITTVAGTGSAPFNGDGILATSANLSSPITVIVNSSGNLLIADSGNYRVRMLDMSSGLIWTVAGSGSASGCCGIGDGGPATKAALDVPAGLAISPSGPLFISELQGNRVREVSLPSPYASTAVTTSANASSVPSGNPVTLTATLSAINGLASNATGTVTFLDGTSTFLASVAVANGSAVFSSSSLSQGVHTINAIYSGDTAFGYAVAPPFSLTITAPQAAVALAASPNPAIANQPFTLAATLTPLSATGTVTFLNGSSTLGTAPVTSGTATLSGITLASGSYSLTAQYGGGNGFGPATSPALSLTVKAVSSVAVTSSANPSNTKQSPAFTATVTPPSATGSVQFLDGSTPLGSATLTNGVALFTPPSLGQGAHSITAAYAGDANDTSATSAVLTQTVQASSTVTLTSTANPAAVGAAVTFTATVAPSTATGNVQFLDGTTPLGSIALANGTAALTTSTLIQGSHSITASYSGDANDTSATSAVLTQTVQASSTVALMSTANPAAVGAAVTFTATVTPAAATGTVQFLDGTSVLGTAALSNGAALFTTSSLSQGTHSITASYSGDANDSASVSAILSESVKVTSGFTTGVSPSPAIAGQTVTLTANLNSAATGTVTFTDGGTVLATVPVVSGTAAFSTSSLAQGSHMLGVSYSGDATYLGIATTIPETVLGSTTIMVGSNLNPALSGQAVVFTATVSPSAATGTVQFYDGSTLLGTPALTNGVATYSAALSPGTHTITADYGGSSAYGPSYSSVLSEIVKSSTSVTISSSLNPSTAGSAVTFTAVVSPSSATGTVQFLDGATLLGSATLAGGRASFTTSSLLPGAQSITASYLGDALDAPSNSAALTETVNPGVPAAPSNLAAAAAGSSEINLTWTASATAGVTYNVYESTASGFTPSATNRIASGVTATAYAAAGLNSSTTYYYRVTAVNAGGESAASNQASATTTGAFACHVSYSVTSQWNNGFTGAISIQNSGTTKITSWTLTWAWPGNQAVTQSWNANYEQSGADVSLTNESYNGQIAAGGTISGIGFNGSYSGSNSAPSAFYVNGTLCH